MTPDVIAAWAGAIVAIVASFTAAVVALSSALEKRKQMELLAKSLELCRRERESDKKG